MTELIRSFANDFGSLVTARANQPLLITPAEIDPLELSYREVGQLVERCLSFFKQQGLKHGDVVFSLMPNSAETLILFFASIVGGYGFAPLPCVASAREIDRWVSLVKPKLCVTTDLIATESKAALLERGVPVKLIETNARFQWLPSQQQEITAVPGARIYLSTSGTTGEPKAMVLDSNILWSSGNAFVNFHGLSDAELRFWNYLPMSYLGGLFNLALIPLCTGGSIVIDETFSGKTFLQFWQTVERFDINAAWFVPTIVRGLLSMSERMPSAKCLTAGSKIKTAFVGTAPIELATKLKFEKVFGLKMYENFALSETTFFSSETAENCVHRVEGSAGTVLPYAEVKLVAVDDSEASAKEIYVRSPFLFLGYFQEDGTVSLPLDSDNYFATGDLGFLSEDGTLVVRGRSKDFIKKGGYLVPLREVEVLAEQMPGVREAAAVKTSHSFYGESFDLYVILDPSAESESIEAELASYVHKNLVKYKWPEKILSVDEFPRTAGGKVQKHLIGTKVKV